MQENQKNINLQNYIKDQNNNIFVVNEIINTDSTENLKNIDINLPSNNEHKGSFMLERQNSNGKKKKRVSFIDQIQSKNIAQIIFINDKASLNDDKRDYNKYVEQFRKQGTNISELNKNKNNHNTNDIYIIKRPKKNSLFKQRKKEKVQEQSTCTCTCIIF